MKSTNSMGKGNFEKAWREAFEGAQLTPSDQLWTGIEANIANEEVARYRRGMAYYRWLAAAGVLLFTVLLGYLSYRDLNIENSLVENSTDRKNHQDAHFGTDSVLSKTKKNKNINSPLSVQESTPLSFRSETGTTSHNQKRTSEKNTYIKRLTLVQPKQSKTISFYEKVSLPPLPERVFGVPIYKTGQDPERMVLWAGLNIAPGYFNPNYQSLRSVQGLQPTSIDQGGLQQEEDHRTGFSMSFGFEMGMKLSNRWQLSSGIQYLNNHVQSSTNAILDNRTPVFSSVIESLDLSDSRTNVTYDPTELNSTFQFLSIPIQAGFLVLDKRVKVLVNAGMASDIFLKNRITAVDQSLESITINPGSNAPFKSVYFNGLVGAEASYELLPRYLITLEPRYKLAISNFTRPDNTYSSLPSSFGIGVGVKYIFK